MKYMDVFSKGYLENTVNGVEQAIAMSEEKQKEIISVLEGKKYVSAEERAQADSLRAEKQEFDEMTIAALIRAKSVILVAKKIEKDDYEAELVNRREELELAVKNMEDMKARLEEEKNKFAEKRAKTVDLIQRRQQGNMTEKDVIYVEKAKKKLQEIDEVQMVALENNISSVDNEKSRFSKDIESINRDIEGIDNLKDIYSEELTEYDQKITNLASKLNATQELEKADIHQGESIIEQRKNSIRQKMKEQRQAKANEYAETYGGRYEQQDDATAKYVEKDQTKVEQESKKDVVGEKAVPEELLVLDENDSWKFWNKFKDCESLEDARRKYIAEVIELFGLESFEKYSGIEYLNNGFSIWNLGKVTEEEYAELLQWYKDNIKTQSEAKPEEVQPELEAVVEELPESYEPIYAVPFVEEILHESEQPEEAQPEPEAVVEELPEQKPRYATLPSDELEEEELGGFVDGIPEEWNFHPVRDNNEKAVVNITINKNGARANYNGNRYKVEISEIQELIDLYADDKEAFVEEVAFLTGITHRETKTLDELLDKIEEKSSISREVLNKIDPTVVAIASKMSQYKRSNTDPENKKDYEELMDRYMKSLNSNEKDEKMNIKYDLKSFSKTTSLFARFRKEFFGLTDKKFIAQKAKIALDNGVATVEGEYKQSFLDKIFSRFESRNKSTYGLFAPIVQPIVEQPINASSNKDEREGFLEDLRQEIPSARINEDEELLEEVEKDTFGHPIGGFVPDSPEDILEEFEEENR